MNIVLLQQQIVFIVGFVIGFVTVFLSKYTGHIFESPVFYKHSSKAIWNLVESWSKNSETYAAWRQKQNLHISKIDLDYYIYGRIQSNNNSVTKNDKIILESEWLKDKIPITCVVLVEKLKLATAIKETWGQQCNQLLFFSHHLSDLDLSVINLGIKYTSSWQMLCEIMSYIWKRRKEIPVQWLIFVNDDTIVIPENLRYMVAPLNFNEAHYLGHAIVLWGTPYNVAQAGYVLSYEVLRRLMSIFDSSEKCAAGGKYWKKEDFYLGKHLTTLGIHPSDTRDLEQRGTFHGYSLNVLMWGSAKPGNYYTRALYPIGPECCSNLTVTLSIGEPDKMRTICYLLYRLNIFERGTYGNRPAPTPIPEDQVWKLALLEEFNLTDIEDISSDKYFQIWRTKYSEPEYFIAKNFKNKPDIHLNHL